MSSYKNKYKQYRRPTNSLSSLERVAVIKRYLYLHESMNGLAERFHCSSSQVFNILRRRNEYLSEKDKIEIKAEQYRFSTVGTIIAEFAQRLTASGRLLTDEMLNEKAREAEHYIKAPGQTCLTSCRFLRRVKTMFYLTGHPFRSSDQEEEDKSKKSLAIIDIIKELMDSFDPESTEPQLLRMRDMRKYFRYPPMDYSYDDEEMNYDEDEDNCDQEIMSQTCVPNRISTFSDKINVELGDNEIMNQQTYRPTGISTSPCKIIEELDDSDDHKVMKQIYLLSETSTSPCKVKKGLDDNANYEIINQQPCPPTGISMSPCKIIEKLDDSDDHEIVNKVYPNGISPAKHNAESNDFNVEIYCYGFYVNDINDSQIDAVITANKTEAGIADTLTATNDGASGIKVENPGGKLKSYEEALKLLGPLEEFVLLRANIKATGLINQLENIFTDEMKKEIG